MFLPVNNQTIAEKCHEIILLECNKIPKKKGGKLYFKGKKNQSEILFDEKLYVFNLLAKFYKSEIKCQKWFSKKRLKKIPFYE